MMRKRFFVALALIFIGTVARIWLRPLLPEAPHFYIHIANYTCPVFMIDMFFLIAAISMVSGRYLGKYGFAVPLSIMIISDIYFGGGLILLFTWSGFLMLFYTGYATSKRAFYSYMGYGILSIIAYDVWTNFGSWLGWYPHTIDGFILCYAVAIPFMLWHLISTTIALPILSIPFEYAKLHDAKNIAKSFALDGKSRD